MKRSSINNYIVEALAFFAANHFELPPFAHWTPEQWQERGNQAAGLRAQRLGWDITDFNSGQFDKQGLTLFTLRNGRPLSHEAARLYAEKIMFVRHNQVTPLHYHSEK